jgi:hypothetical protein
MTGDQSDIVARLKVVLPGGWFADETPLLDCVLAGLGCAWAWVYQTLQYVTAQTRIATATDVWLDVIARDYFGRRLVRRAGQADDPFRRRIMAELLRERGTRAAVIGVLKDLTGRSPIVFEPSRATDTGAYGAAGGGWSGLAYGAAGGWGSLNLPFQFFVTAYRPAGSGIAFVAGWGSGCGGYNKGAVEYGNLAMLQGQVTDVDINAAAASVLPIATTGWLRITN